MHPPPLSPNINFDVVGFVHTGTLPLQQRMVTNNHEVIAVDCQANVPLAVPETQGDALPRKSNSREKLRVKERPILDGLPNTK